MNASPSPSPAVPAMAHAARPVGRIVSVTGKQAIVLLEDSGPGQAVTHKKSPEIGTLLRIDTPIAVVLCLVSALSAPMPAQEAGDSELRIVEVEFVGELPKGEKGETRSFKRGVSYYPSLGDLVFRASQEELGKAYACDAQTAIRIGHIRQDMSIPAMVKIDELLGKHFSVLGTTGSGKSCSVALILRRILERSPQAHMVLLDMHREYSTSFRECAEIISPDNLNLPFWLLTFEEVVEVLIGEQAHREADVEVLRDLIPIAKTRYAQNQRKERTLLRSSSVLEPGMIGVDTPVPYRVSDLVQLLEEMMGKLELKGELAPYKRLKARIEAIMRDSRFGFMFGNLAIQDTMVELLGRMFRVPVNGKPISIFELGVSPPR
jgi:hypothetical protein